MIHVRRNEFCSSATVHNWLKFFTFTCFEKREPSKHSLALAWKRGGEDINRFVYNIL